MPQLVPPHASNELKILALSGDALNLELKNTLVCADYFSWEIYGFVYFSYNLEY